MRTYLSNVICKSARDNPNLYVLTGDHGYALFDEIRKERPDQFINAGVAEQAMIGYASGMNKVGLKTIVYGLSAFLPIRVLEQIKLDLCESSRPVIMIGDGAGLVYSVLGSSHQCAEDIACLRPLPNLSIYAPADRHELQTCFEEALQADHPVYIRIGKSDRPEVHSTTPKKSGVHSTHKSPNSNHSIALIGMGSMASVAQSLAKNLALDAFSVSRIKPFYDLGELREYKHLIAIEEHSKFGGLFSTLSELISQDLNCKTKLTSYSLTEKFAEKCGSYQYALSEHQMSDEDLSGRVQARVAELRAISS